MNSDSAALRILDASLNRANEGLRVVEDYVRFVLDDVHLTEQFKSLRHDLTAVASTLPLPERHAARDTQHDVGTNVTTAGEQQRADAWAVCCASLERLKQSLRSLEEYWKVTSPDAAAAFESLRYRLYTLESALGRTAGAIERLAKVRLCVIVDGRSSESEFCTLLELLVAGGVDAIQLRDKQLSDRELIERARSLRKIANRSLVIINDRPDIAAIVDADGVHLGQDDAAVKDVRGIVGPRKLIGVSAHSIEQARAALLAGANYLGAGPTFPSKTKNFDAFPGIPLLKQVAAEIRLPAFAIGGITVENADQVVAAGIGRIAVSAAVIEAADPAAAAKKLRSMLNPSQAP
jgi:thiamine-phosphate pyrophosphorylase